MPTDVESLTAFFDEHRRRGRLDTGLDDEREWMTCECGGAMGKVLKPNTPRPHERGEEI